MGGFSWEFNVREVWGDSFAVTVSAITTCFFGILHRPEDTPPGEVVGHVVVGFDLVFLVLLILTPQVPS